MSVTRDKFLAAVFTLLPHHFISRLVLRVSHSQRPWLKKILIRNYAKHFRIDLSEALEQDLAAYPSMNAFFTRALKPGARPLPDDSNILVSPVDGTISQIGSIEEGLIFQAKGQYYSLQTLVGGDENLATPFRNGGFATIYLSPRDYHRIHMPFDGELTDMIYVPGRLFSVAPFSVNEVPSLFARNERVVCLFNTSAGRMAVILVGAINVAAIETPWAGLVTPPPGKQIRHTRYEQPLTLLRGMEMGRFNMGSTVIVLTEKNPGQWRPGLIPFKKIKMGESLSTL